SGLNPIAKMRTKIAESYLCSLPGVGIKTARCVLMYSLQRPVFPADTHCLRIMERLGWIHWSDRRRELMADVAQAGIPPGLRRVLHIPFVQAGRATCNSQPTRGR